MQLVQARGGDAIARLEEAIRLDPTDAKMYYNRAVAYETKAEYDLAIADFTAAIRLAPAYIRAYNRVAWLFATCPTARYRDGAKAVENATRACELTQWKDSPCLGTVAAAYAELGEFEEAVYWQTRAIELATAAYDKAAAQSRLELYKAGQPFRQELKR